jgi:hypothetical protein
MRDSNTFEMHRLRVALSLTARRSHLLRLTTSGGIISSPTCGTSIDHGVLVVGYGTDTMTKQPYYIVKNSWGPKWSIDMRMRASTLCNAPWEAWQSSHLQLSFAHSLSME